MATTPDNSSNPDLPTRPSWTIRVLGRLLAAVMTLAALAEAGSLTELFAYAPYDEARYRWYLGIAIAALFILNPFKKDAPRLKVPIIDGAIAVSYTHLTLPTKA